MTGEGPAAKLVASLKGTLMRHAALWSGGSRRFALGRFASRTKHVSRGASGAAGASCPPVARSHHCRITTVQMGRECFVSRVLCVTSASRNMSCVAWRPHMHVRSACLALGLAAVAMPANAQNWVYEPDTPGQPYQPRATYAAPAPAYVPDRQVEYSATDRTVVPQGRGRAPIVRERVVTQTYPAWQSTRQGVLAAPVGVDYSDYVGDRAAADYAMAPVPQVVVRPRARRVVVTPPAPQVVVNPAPAPTAYRYMVINNRLLVVDPTTGLVMADVTQ